MVENKFANMFPKKLDNAQVLYYTPLDNYGETYYTTGEIADHIRYLAICKYQNDHSYYLFGCNINYEVVSDSPWESIQECKNAARSSYQKNIPWVAMA